MSRRHARIHKTAVWPVFMIMLLVPAFMAGAFAFVDISERWIANAENVDFPGGYAAARQPLPTSAATASRNLERQPQPSPSSSQPDPTAPTLPEDVDGLGASARAAVAEKQPDPAEPSPETQTSEAQPEKTKDPAEKEPKATTAATAEPAPEQTTSPDSVTPATTVIDTSSKSAVKSAYNKMVAQNLITEKQPTVSECSVAATSSDTRARTLDAINFSRALVGLSPVTFSDEFNSKSEQAALVQALQGHLSHTPSPGDCNLTVGVEASGQSNLSMGTHGARNILAYLADGGEHNAAVGHRKHILNPGQQQMGVGYAGNYGALYVFGPTSAKNPTPEWIAWPAAGFFPAEMEPSGRWSFTTTAADADFSAATVTVTRRSTTVEADIIHRDGSGARYGDQVGVTFTVPQDIIALNSDGRANVTVTVSGIRSGGKEVAAQTYTVKLFAAQ